MLDMSLYRASGALMRHLNALKKHLFGTIHNLFGLEHVVTLYDLTNTYFEGAAGANPKVRHGRSKEKRSDCPMVTLGLALTAVDLFAPDPWLRGLRGNNLVTHVERLKSSI